MQKMMKNFHVPDVNKYKTFRANGKYGLKRWDGFLIMNPVSHIRPNVIELEENGHTFILLDDGFNVVNELGDFMIHDIPVKHIGWFKSNVVAFEEETGSCGLLFLETKKMIRGISDAICEQHFIRTLNNNMYGVVTYHGKEIFPARYLEVTIFWADIFIAYCPDGGAILNSENWDEPIQAQMFKKMQGGIIFKQMDEYQWLNMSTGKPIPNEQLTKAKKQLLAFAKKIKC